MVIFGVGSAVEFIAIVGVGVGLGLGSLHIPSCINRYFFVNSEKSFGSSITRSIWFEFGIIALIPSKFGISFESSYLV